MVDEHISTTRSEGETLDMPEGSGAFAPGQVSGQRFRIVSQLGHGGMGEVWRAFDLKLRVEVALKALRPELLADPRRLDLLRQEVRVARQVTSPNVCRVYDLVEVEGRELVSMEYIDGHTLLDELRQRAPFDPSEAQAIVAQLLSGLEAIHGAGLVHRDIKPENIMLTRTGRVVVMDFGIARSAAEGAGSVSGTPAYMAPEQTRGEAADLRSDIFSVGVMLAEMVSPDGIRDAESRQSVWEGLRRDPVEVPQSPWAGVIRKAVARDPADRFASTAELQRALEDLAFRVHDERGLDPYPGLAAFDISDCEYFFGREAEVEAVWTRLDSAHLLAVVGASGVGKSSFLGAGVIPAKPADWGVLRCTPGNQAVGALKRAVEKKSGEKIAAGDDDSLVAALTSWRLRHDEALLIVDQFEEVFTQNPADEQRRVAALIGRLVLDADVHVLLSLRDDFLLRCHEHAELAPVFSELTPLRPPVGGALRRAVVQPALHCGYRFEDDELADELLAEVEGERGALPLLAFALASLWQRRDRESGLLTRQAYHDIGGVGGALARHAEATIDRIGTEHIGIVRELFRNLVTAEGTRAIREWDELLSIFRDSRSELPEEVLRALIDARLLTSYEVRGGDETPTRRVEIIHESLLSAWPRLVRWRTQDADAAQLRDQLRQSARTWEEHERSDDLLWTGSTYREFSVWRESYPGGLTEIEEAFASAMKSLATRRRRRRRAAVAAAFVVLIGVTAVIGRFWQGSVAEARRAEAAHLVSLGQLEIGTNPSATVAHAIASLEQADSGTARMLALEALWQGPTALVASEKNGWRCKFGHDGSYIVATEISRAQRPEGLLSILYADGTRVRPENPHCEMVCLFISDVSATGHMVSFNDCEDGNWEYVLWSMPEGTPLGSVRYAFRLKSAVDEERHRHVMVGLKDGHASVDTLGHDGAVRHVGTLEHQFPTLREWFRNLRLSSNGRWIAVVVENELLVIEIGDDHLTAPRPLRRADHGVTGFNFTGQWLSAIVDDEALVFDMSAGRPTEPRHVVRVSKDASDIAFDPQARFVATLHSEGEIRLWSLTETAPPMVLEGPQGVEHWIEFNDNGSRLESWAGDDKAWTCRIWNLSRPSPRFQRNFEIGFNLKWLVTSGRLSAAYGRDPRVLVWSMDAPADAEPLVLVGAAGEVQQMSFSPDGEWLATVGGPGGGALRVWPLAKRYPSVIRRHDQHITDVEFAPDGSWLASASADGTVKLWPLVGDPPPSGRTLLAMKSELNFVSCNFLAASPDGSRILVGTNLDGPWILRSDGQAPINLGGFKDASNGVAFSADGRLAASAGGEGGLTERVIRVWDVESEEEVRVLDVGEQPWPDAIAFTPDGHLLSSSESGLLRWDVETGAREVLYEGGKFRWFSASADGRRVLMVEGTQEADDWGRGVLLDLDSGTATRLDGFGGDMRCPVFDTTGTLVANGNGDGEIAVGRADGSEPHLLLGHEGAVNHVAIDPLGRWIASGGSDKTVRLWPMPDLSKPPLHTLPREELIVKLKTLTNLRVVRDAESPSGWKIEAGPFPGWETVPTW